MDSKDFLNPVSEAEIKAVYWINVSSAFPQLPRVKNRLTSMKAELLRHNESGYKLVYYVAIFIQENEPILEEDIVRWLCDNKASRGTPGARFKVACRIQFRISQKFQRAGLATYLLEREEQVFRKWGAREIQVSAMEDGRWVWTRPRFGYQIDSFQFESVQEKYKEWQRRCGSDVVSVGLDISSLPREFLMSDEVGCLNLFKPL